MPARRVTSFSEKAMCMMFMKGLPLANRWPYTDGSAGLGTSGESAMLFSRGRVDLIVLVIVSSLFFVAFSFIVLVIQRVYTVFHPVELFHRCH